MKCVTVTPRGGAGSGERHVCKYTVGSAAQLTPAVLGHWACKSQGCGELGAAWLHRPLCHTYFTSQADASPGACSGTAHLCSDRLHSEGSHTLVAPALHTHPVKYLASGRTHVLRPTGILSSQQALGPESPLQGMERRPRCSAASLLQPQVVPSIRLWRRVRETKVPVPSPGGAQPSVCSPLLHTQGS